MLIGAAWSTGTAAQTVGQDWKVERLEKEVMLGERGTVEVHNDFGDLRVRAAPDDRITVSAIVQRHQDDLDRPTIAVTETADTIHVTIAYAGKPPSGEAGGAQRRADVTVFVPRDPRLHLRTDSGLLNIRADNDIYAETVAGKVDIKTAGLLRATSTRGSILAVLKQPTWSGLQRLTTKTGDIELWLPRGTDATVEAETGGRITVDYSVEIRHDDALGRKHARAQIGAGGGRLEVESVNGAVLLLRSP